MKKQNIISIMLLVITFVFTIVSYLVLPDTVITQVSISGSAASTMPKLYAVGLPALLGIGGSIVSFLNSAYKRKAFIISGAGILVFIVMLIVNL